MKKLIQKIVQMAMVAAVLLPSASIAEFNAPNAMKWGGGILAVGGGVAWYAQNDEVDKCKSAGSSCINLSDLEDAAATRRNIGLAGAGIMILGFVLDNKSGFQVRSVPGGVAIERKGLSFSTTVNGKAKLQKSWEF